MAFQTETSGKFVDPLRTAKDEPRAHVGYTGTKTLWFNTGTLCNIECINCYIESSPTNDKLVYLTVEDIDPYLDELEEAGETGIEIGFTGGEPFMAPEMIGMMDRVLARGHHILMLTNAMRPMMRPMMREGILNLAKAYPDRMVFRVSLDHYSAKHHDIERGAGSYEKAIKGLKWLATTPLKVTIAGRSMWNEEETDAREGYGALVEDIGLDLDPQNANDLVLFPEMDTESDPPEISTECWGILDKSPSDMMCASQRMVVKRKGAKKTSVLACTLLPYDEEFELGETLTEARKPVSLNHPYCASFCVLGGGSCSA